MKTVVITVPVVGVAYLTVEVDDSVTDAAEVIEAIEMDELEVTFHPNDAQCLTPYLDLSKALEDSRSGYVEFPELAEVEFQD